MDPETKEITSPEQIINLDEAGWSGKEKSYQVLIGEAGANLLESGVSSLSF